MEDRPVVASGDAPLVLRRGPAAPAYLALTGALLLGAAALLASQGSSYALPVLALGVAGAGWPGLVWARSRTEIGPEGILNRTVRAEVLIPWPEIIRVAPLAVTGTVLVVRRGGRATTLAGLRDRGTRDGLDQVIGLIEERIASRSGSRPVPAVIARRLRLAPFRGFLLLLTALGVLAGLYAMVCPATAVAAVVLLGAAAFVFAATLRARTEIGPDGVRNRALLRTVFVPWADVADVDVTTTAHRTVRVVRRSGKRMVLAAVRDADVQVDGLGLDDVADAIRTRAETGRRVVR